MYVVFILLSARVPKNGYTGELGYDGPLYDGYLHMTDDMLGPSPMHIKYLSYVYDGFAYDGPIFIVPLSPSYPSSPVSSFGQTGKLIVAPDISGVSKGRVNYSYG